MVKDNELLRRLRRVPEDRRLAFLQQVRDSAASTSPVALSARQEQLWLLNRVSDRGGYELAFRFDIDGALDEAALGTAVELVMARHDVLRSTVPTDRETAVRLVRPPQPVRLAVDDIRHLPPEQAAELLDRAVASELRQGFDWDSGPQVRMRLFRTGSEHHVLLWLTHYLVFDEESAHLVLSDLAAGYRVALADRNGDDQSRRLEPPRVPFAQYAAWQREWLSSSLRVGPALEYWRATLAGWQATELPPDLPRPRTLDLTAATVRRALPGDLLAAVERVATDVAASTPDVLLAAYVALLARYTVRDDVMIGLPVRASEPAGVEHTVGDCGNLVPVRVDLTGAPSFAEIVRRVNAARLGAIEHSALPFSEILAGAARAIRDATRLPLTPIGFGLRTVTTTAAVAGAVSMSVAPVETGAGTFELLLNVLLGERPEAVVVYASTLYRRDGVELLLDRYVALLAAGLAEPSVRHTRLPLCSPAELAQIAEWNRTDAPREAVTVHGWFARAAARTPDALALISRQGTMTYRTLDESANRLAHRLRALGAGTERTVAVYLGRGLDMIVAVLAVLKSGAAYVPLDPEHPAERLGVILADSGAQLVLTHAALADRLPPGQWQPVVLDDSTTAAAIAAQRADAPRLVVAPQNLAYVIYTSGTTGRPKGVLIEHRNVTNFVHSVRDMFALTAQDRVLQFASLGFDVSVFEIFGALLSSAQLYVVDNDQRRSLDLLDQVLVEHGITVIDLPPALMELLATDRYPQLRVAFVGGEAFTGELTTRWAAGRDFYNGYGPTETTVTVVAKRCTGIWTSTPPIGTAMANIRAYTCDSELALTPAGVAGELVIAGGGVGRGYLGAAALTAERFRPDPAGPPGARAYCTGDLAVWRPEGELVFLGRIDRQVKVRGIRIELGDVESAVMAGPDVAQAVVRSTRNVRQDVVLVAYVVFQPDAEADVTSLRADLAARLPLAMVPSFIIPVEAIPLTPSGKIDERRLPEVDPADVGTADEDDAVRTPTERRLVDEVFLPLLGAARVGPHDNFFALGGTSLQAIRVIPRVRAVFGVEIPVAEFFQAPTATAIASVVDRALAAARDRDQDLASILMEVESRSEEEVEEMLRVRFGEGD